MITFRAAEHSDLDALCRIEQSCFGEDAFTRRQMHYLLSQAKGLFLIALTEGAIAGYISLLLRKHTCNVRIYSIAITAELRGRGIARELVEQAMAFAAAHNRTTLTLEVRCDNAAAIALYRRFGFICTERLRGYYHSSDGWRMTLKMI